MYEREREKERESVCTTLIGLSELASGYCESASIAHTYATLRSFTTKRTNTTIYHCFESPLVSQALR
jgi:hypothetical protein